MPMISHAMAACIKPPHKPAATSAIGRAFMIDPSGAADDASVPVLSQAHTRLIYEALAVLVL
jgi:hypothetical protein